MKMHTKLIDSNICPAVDYDEEGEEYRVCNENTHHVDKFGFCAHVVPTEKEGQYTWYFWNDKGDEEE